MEEGKQTLSELLIGIIICAAFIAALSIVFVDNQLSYIIGISIGVIVAMMMSISMYRSLAKSLDMEMGAAIGFTNRKALLRLLLMVAAIALSVIAPKYVSFLGVVFGILCLKLSAYIQPLTHKLIKNKGR